MLINSEWINEQMSGLGGGGGGGGGGVGGAEGASPMRHRVGWEGPKFRRREALTHLSNILRVFFSFFLSSAPGKAEREILLELTIFLGNIGGTFRKSGV